MTESKATPRPKSRGVAARKAQAEKNGKLRTIKLTVGPVAGLVMEDCPPDLPGTFSWDAARVQGRSAEEDPRVVGDLYRLIESVIGEDNSEAIRRRLATKKADPGLDVLMNVLNDITEHYGTGMGESSASPQS